MAKMRIRGPLTGVLAIALLLMACVPEPANRVTQSPLAEVATPTPVPTPAGPTPTPSFVRPTPTPEPTFLIYTVVAGDNLGKIAKRFKTNVQSIAYWNRAIYPSLDPESAAYRENDIKIGWTFQIIPGAKVDPENLPTLPPPPVPSGSDAPSELPAGD